MKLNFTQYLRPNGEKRKTVFLLPDESASSVKAFVLAGGRFECEILTTKEVSLTAVFRVDGEDEDVACELVANDGVDIGPALVKLVETAHQWLMEYRRR